MLTRAVTPTHFYARVQAINESLALANPSTLTRLATWVGLPFGFMCVMAAIVMYAREIVLPIAMAVGAIGIVLFVGSIILVIVHAQRVERIMEQYVGGLMSQFCSEDAGRLAWRYLVWETIKPVITTHVDTHQHQHGDHTHSHNHTHQQVQWRKQKKRAIEIQVLV